MNSIFAQCLAALVTVTVLSFGSDCRAQDAGASDTKRNFGVFQQGDKYLLQIADSLLGRDVLVLSRIVETLATPTNMRNNRGGKTMEEIIRFRRGVKNKIYLDLVCYERNLAIAHSETDSALRNTGRIIKMGEFDILRYYPESAILIVDISSLINNETSFIYISGGGRNIQGLSKYNNIILAVKTVESNPGSVEIRTTRHAENKLLLDLNTSLLVLPKKPMRPRFADSRLNYNEQKLTKFGPLDSTLPDRAMVTRWRLEPKAADREDYEKGKLVEPEKPIVYYIDTATPEKWVPWFIQAVTDWQKAFEKAGFKNAILAKRVPPDSLFILNDVRYSVIKYNTFKTGDATFSYVIDPRSGEILQSNVLWNQVVADNMCRRFIIQASPSDKRLWKPVMSDSIRGEVMRYIIQHEVGHTLGFDHNRMASNAIPVEKLRNKKWVEKNGICPSVMDYARFNYVAQPGDSITARKGLIVDIGVYDEWAIKWGYSVFPGNYSQEAEEKILDKWTRQRASTKVFRDGPNIEADPRTQAEDLGDDAVQAGMYGIKNLQLVMSQLSQWAKDGNCDKATLALFYNQLIFEYYMYLVHTASNIVGEYVVDNHSGSSSPKPLPDRLRKRALDFMEAQLFNTPLWLIDTVVLNRAGLTAEKSLDVLHKALITHCLTPRVLIRLNAREGTHSTYPLSLHLRNISQRLFRNLDGNHLADTIRTTLQLSYIEQLIAYAPGNKLTNTPSESKTTVAGLIREELLILRDQIKKAAGNSKVATSKKYFDTLLAPLNKLLDGSPM